MEVVRQFIRQVGVEERLLTAGWVELHNYVRKKLFRTSCEWDYLGSVKDIGVRLNLNLMFFELYTSIIDGGHCEDWGLLKIILPRKDMVASSIFSLDIIW